MRRIHLTQINVDLVRSCVKMMTITFGVAALGIIVLTFATTPASARHHYVPRGSVDERYYAPPYNAYDNETWVPEKCHALQC
jgi:hypothetical protein